MDINDSVSLALHSLVDGNLVVLPTETVYGLGADAENESAVAAIYEMKGRPSHNPLIVHVKDAEMARRYGEWNSLAEQLAQAFWPGPLAMVLERAAGSTLASAVSAGRPTIALRCPNHPVAQALLTAFGRGIAAPSANRSGRVSPTSAAHVRDEFGDAVMVIDGGACDIGIESTIVAVHEETVRILRPGSITYTQLCEVLGHAAIERPAFVSDDISPSSPGQLSSHYAPALPVRMNVHSVKEGEVLLQFGPLDGIGASDVISLSDTGDVNEAAARLYHALREADQPHHYKAIAVMPVPEEGVGIAMNDRLRRASAETA